MEAENPWIYRFFTEKEKHAKRFPQGKRQTVKEPGSLKEL